jgi:hypothetical protein
MTLQVAVKTKFSMLTRLQGAYQSNFCVTLSGMIHRYHINGVLEFIKIIDEIFG